jgi:hypothetical protein
MRIMTPKICFLTERMKCTFPQAQALTSEQNQLCPGCPEGSTRRLCILYSRRTEKAAAKGSWVPRVAVGCGIRILSSRMMEWCMW